MCILEKGKKKSMSFEWRRQGQYLPDYDKASLMTRENMKCRHSFTGLGCRWESKGSLDCRRDQLDESPLEPEKAALWNVRLMRLPKINICCGFRLPVNYVGGINTQDVCLLLCGTAPWQSFLSAPTLHREPVKILPYEYQLVWGRLWKPLLFTAKHKWI